MAVQGSNGNKSTSWLGQFGVTPANIEDRNFIQQLASQSDKHTNGERGLSAFVAKQLMIGLSEQEIMALASQVALARYQQLGNGSEVFRNQEQFSRAFFNEFFMQFDYPLGLADRTQFFAMFESAINGNKQAQAQLQQALSNPPDELIQALLPFYHEYMQKPKNNTDKGKKDLGDYIIFAFVETKAADLSVVDGTPMQRIMGLPIALRLYKRDHNLGEAIVQKLEQANKNYTANPPQNFQNAQTKMRQAVQDYGKFKANNQRLKETFEPNAMKIASLCRNFATAHKEPMDISENMRSLAVTIEYAVKNEVERREMQGHPFNESDALRINQFVQAQLNQALAIAEQQKDKDFIVRFKAAGAISNQVVTPTLLSRATTAVQSFIGEKVLPLLNKAAAALQGFPSFNAMKANWQGANVQSAKTAAPLVSPPNNAPSAEFDHQIDALGESIAHFGAKSSVDPLNAEIKALEETGDRAVLRAAKRAAVQSKKVPLDVPVGAIGMGNNPLYQAKDKDPTAPVTKQAVKPVDKGAILTAYPSVVKTLISVTPPINKPLEKPEPPSGKSPRAKH